MKTIAAVLQKHNGRFKVEEIDIAPVKEDEIRVKITATGVCHTDAVARAAEGLFPLPGILGHEGSGVVEEVGDLITDFKVGDKVILSYAACHHCNNCLEGHPFVCEEFVPLNFGGFLKGGNIPYSKDNQSLSVFFGQSSFSQRVNVKAENAVKVNHVSEEELALFGPLGCGIQTGAGTVINHLRPKAGESIVVFGSGAVGLSAIMAAKVVGATPIIAVDIHDSRLELAKELGATHIINSQNDDPVTKITEILDGKKAHYSIDTTGIAQVVKNAVAAIKPLGTMAIVGITGEVTFNVQSEIMAEGKKVVGVIEGDSIPQIFIPQLIKLYQQGNFPFDRLVKFYTLEQINEAFDDSASGKVIKPIVKM